MKTTLTPARMLAAATLLMTTSAAATESAARIEAYPVQTIDLTTAQVLAGVVTGPAAVVAGELRLPPGTDARVPAVVFLHGDAGEVSNQPPWIDELNAIGIAVFTLDSFSGRGFVSKSARMGAIDGANGAPALPRIVDAYRALALLAKHPRIDASRIALMGVSSGGRTTIAGLMTRFTRLYAEPGTAFVAGIALYPPCNARLIDDDRFAAVPLRIYSGGEDNVTRAAPCERYVARLRAAGRDAEAIVYPGAYHGFDNPPGTPLTRMPDLPGSADCLVEERSVGTIVNVDTGLPLVAADACIKRGFIAGRDDAADAAVRPAVRDFLRTTFRLPAR